MRTRISLAVILGSIICLSSAAQAHLHLWRISQIYSNADGSVQYVDFVLPNAFDDERFLNGVTLSATLNSDTLTLNSDLPSLPVKGSHFLVATPGFAAVAHVTPDYTFAIAPFFNRAGDTLTYASGIDRFVFSSLPVDGVSALNRDGTISPNDPINFAGNSGFIPEPTTGASMVAGLSLLLRRRNRIGNRGAAKN